METDTSPAPTVFFRPAEPTDLPTLAAMEVGWPRMHYLFTASLKFYICNIEVKQRILLQAASYPPDEAASPERLAFRLEHGMS